jgi:hypothetical protein
MVMVCNQADTRECLQPWAPVRMLNSFGTLVSAELSRPAHHMWMIEAMDTIKAGLCTAVDSP